MNTTTTAPFATPTTMHVLGPVKPAADGGHEARCSCGQVISTREFPSQSAAMCRSLGWRHLDHHARLGATVAGY